MEYLKLIDADQSEIAEWIVSVIGESHKIEDGSVYVFSEDTKLWVEYHLGKGGTYTSFLMDNITEEMKKVFDKEQKGIVEELNGLTGNSTDNEWKRIKLNLLEKQKKNLIMQKKRLRDTTFLNKVIIQVLNKLLKNNKVKNFKDQIQNHLFPIKGGKVMNLKNGETRERTKEDFFFEESPVEYKEDTPNADKFFNSLMKDKKDYINLLQTVIGYCMTGETTEKAFFILSGVGNNGKSALGSVLESVLGSFMNTGSKGLVIKNKNKNDLAPNPDLLDLRGRRLVFMSESNEGDEFDLATWKGLVGNDKQKCRALFSNEMISFYPKSKILFALNHDIVIDPSDFATVERIVSIVFEAKFSEYPKKGEYKQDSQLVYDLQNSLINETFSWMVRGAIKYYKNGLKSNKLLQKLKNDYVNKQDIKKRYIEKCLKTTKKSFVRKSTIRDHFKQFCATEGQTLKITKQVINKLYEGVSQHFTSGIKDGYQGFKNIELVNSDGEAEEADEEDDELDDFAFEDENTKKLKEENQYLRNELKDAMKRIEQLEMEKSLNLQPKEEPKEETKAKAENILVGKPHKQEYKNTKAFSKTTLSFA